MKNKELIPKHFKTQKQVLCLNCHATTKQKLELQNKAKYELLDKNILRARLWDAQKGY
jgi:hypothetical protein